MKLYAILICMVLIFSEAIAAPPPSLEKVADIPLPGKTTRFDYQGLNPETGILYFSHMGDGELVVFDCTKRQVVDHLTGFSTVTGVIVVPEIHRVFASVPGNHEVAVVDTESLKVVARVSGGKFPDGLAYAPEIHKLFVSDEAGEKELVIDTRSNKLLRTIEMEGEVGNTEYDSVSHHILANVQTRNELVVIDPKTEEIISRHKLEGSSEPHGLLIDAPKRLAFAACEGNSKLLVIDLESFHIKKEFSTGRGPDVLAFDPGLERLYVACESGVVSVFQLHDKELEKIEDLSVGPNSHTISVNPTNHEVYLPLKNVNGSPVLRIMKPSK